VFLGLNATFEPVIAAVYGVPYIAFSSCDHHVDGHRHDFASHHRFLVGGISIDYQFDPRRALSG
jgi:hypothetical protein